MSIDRLPEPSRRSFLASIPVLGALVGFTPRGHVESSEKWDLSWLNKLTGKHKQVFGFGALENGGGLDVVTNYLDAHEEVYGLKYPDINAVIGIASRSYPINASDAMWKKYELGKMYNVTDPETNAPSVRNLFLHGRPNRLGKISGVEPLMKRGVIFWQCNNALTGVSMQLAKATNQDVAAVKAELVANLNPGVRLIPAHTMLIGLCQEHGCSYEAS